MEELLGENEDDFFEKFLKESSKLLVESWKNTLGSPQKNHC